MSRLRDEAEWILQYPEEIMGRATVQAKRVLILLDAMHHIMANLDASHEYLDEWYEKAIKQAEEV